MLILRFEILFSGSPLTRLPSLTNGCATGVPGPGHETAGPVDDLEVPARTMVPPAAATEVQVTQFRVSFARKDILCSSGFIRQSYCQVRLHKVKCSLRRSVVARWATKLGTFESENAQNAFLRVCAIWMSRTDFRNQLKQCAAWLGTNLHTCSAFGFRQALARLPEKAHGNSSTISILLSSSIMLISIP